MAMILFLFQTQFDMREFCKPFNFLRASHRAKSSEYVLGGDLEKPSKVYSIITLGPHVACEAKLHHKYYAFCF